MVDFARPDCLDASFNDMYGLSDMVFLLVLKVFFAW